MKKILKGQKLIGAIKYINADQIYTVCPGSSDSPEKISNILASENEVYTIY